MYVAERGGDLTTTGLIAFGGAGPVHADGLARKLSVRRLIVPREAGVFSALGFLVAPVSYEVSRSHVTDVGTLDPVTFERLYGALDTEARAVVGAAVPGAAITCSRHADVCYAGQGSTVRVEVFDAASVGRQFSARYAELFGYAYDDLPVQLVTLGVGTGAQARVDGRGFIEVTL
jgi:N-methylhydantoinase A